LATLGNSSPYPISCYVHVCSACDIGVLWLTPEWIELAFDKELLQRTSILY